MQNNPLFIRKENIKLTKAVTQAIDNIETGFIQPYITTALYRAGINREIKVTG